MNGIDNQPLLSICIPTWNRSKFVKIQLESFAEHLKGIDASEIELYISDNCSDDDTEEVVRQYTSQIAAITYNRNEKNIGAAGNFVRCMQWASGKYILLLGDDDILEPGSVKYLLDQLRGNDYGLVHMHPFEDMTEECVVYEDYEAFYKRVSFWFTFMSGSIFRREVVQMVDPSKYVNTHLLQMPYYLLSATRGKNNLLINKQLLKTGLDSSNNGGYKFYEVFVRNYLNIWKELVDNKTITPSCFEYLKKDIYKKFILNYNFMLLVRHKNVKPENANCNACRSGFKITGAKEILKEYYGKDFYYKISWVYYLKFYMKALLKKLCPF